MLLQVKVVPGAANDEIVGPYGDGLKLRVTAAPEKGKANEAVVRLLAAHFGVKPAQIRIVSGHGSPHKRVDIQQ
jgi:uncharacterized protein